MNSLWFLNGGIVAFAFAGLVLLLIHDTPIDLKNLNSDCISSSLESGDVCEIIVSNTNRGLFLRNNTFTQEVLQAKFDTFFSKNYFPRFLTEQVQFLHVFDEAFLAKRFVICASFMVMCISIIELLVVRRMGNLVKSYRALKKLESEESREWRICIIEFAQEKISVLIFCIVRSFPQSNNKHYIDFGEYVRDSLSLRNRSTDITLFACWYCILAICHVSTHSIFHRYVKTIPLLERSLKTRLRQQTVFAIVFLTMNSIAVLSGILLGSALTSTAFIHSDYSVILILESFRMFFRCLYVVDRITMSVSKPRMYQLESMKKLTDERMSEIIANGCQIDMKRRKFQDFYINVTLLLTILLNASYGKIGLFNLKIAALGYFHVCEQMIINLMNTEKYTATDLL